MLNAFSGITDFFTRREALVEEVCVLYKCSTPFSITDVLHSGQTIACNSTVLYRCSTPFGITDLFTRA